MAMFLIRNQYSLQTWSNSLLSFSYNDIKIQGFVCLSGYYPSLHWREISCELLHIVSALGFSLCVSHELGMNLDSYTGGRARKCHLYTIPLFSTFILDGRAFTLHKAAESPVDFSVTTWKSKKQGHFSLFGSF